MAHVTEIENLDAQIATYVSGLSVKEKQAILNLLQTFNHEYDDEQYRAEFKKKWEAGIPLEQSRQNMLAFVRKHFQSPNFGTKHALVVERLSFQ